MKYLYSILGVLVIVGAGYVGYQYGTGKIKLGADDKNTVPVNTNTTTNSAILPLPTNTSGDSLLDAFGNIVNSVTGTSETANWKTYTNQALKFSIQYPADYQVTDKLQKSGDGVASNTLTFSKASDLLQPKFTLWVNPMGFGAFFADVIFQFTTSTTGTVITKRTVATPDEFNTDGKWVLGGMTASVTAGSSAMTSGTTNNANGYLASLEYKEGGTNYETLFRQILTSLKNL